MGKIMTRMGSGFPVEMNESQLMEDLTAGSEDAADRGKIPPLSEEERSRTLYMSAVPCMNPGQTV
jgi:dimethylamine--corrinoid protein Co-methyltransferase